MNIFLGIENEVFRTYIWNMYTLNTIDNPWIIFRAVIEFLTENLSNVIGEFIILKIYRRELSPWWPNKLWIWNMQTIIDALNTNFSTFNVLYFWNFSKSFYLQSYFYHHIRWLNFCQLAPSYPMSNRQNLSYYPMVLDI